MKALLSGHLVAVGVAASYLTLVLANPDQARSLMAYYAVLMLVLTTINLFTERRR